jgi:hypothetical protein
MMISYRAFLISLAYLSLANAGNWIPKSGHNWKYAHNPNEFAQLQASFPDYLAKFDPAIVTYAEFEYQIVAYEGTTKCTSDDPRLTSMRGHYTICDIYKPPQKYCPTTYYQPYGDPCK